MRTAAELTATRVIGKGARAAPGAVGGASRLRAVGVRRSENEPTPAASFETGQEKRVSLPRPDYVFVLRTVLEDVHGGEGTWRPDVLVDTQVSLGDNRWAPAPERA